MDQLFGIFEGKYSVPKVKNFLEIRNVNKINHLQISSDTRYQARNVTPIQIFMINKTDEIKRSNILMKK